MTTPSLSGSSPNGAHRLALPALLIGGVAIGCSPIFVRISELGSVSTAFWRLALALLPLWYLFRRSHTGETARQQNAGHGHSNMLAEPATWHISLRMTSVANSTLLVNMAPIFVTLFSWFALGQKVSRVFLAGLTLSIAGIVVLKWGDSAIGAGSAKGDAVALSAAALYAGYILLLGRLRKIYATIIIMLWSTISAALCTLVLALIVDTAIVPWTLAGWAIVLGLAWISHTGGQSLIAYALAWLPPTFSSLTLLIQPVVAALLAWFLLREPLSMFQITGALIVIAGILIARRG